MKSRILLLLALFGCFAGQMAARDRDAAVDLRRNTGNTVTAIEPTVESIESLPPIGEAPAAVQLKRVYVQSKTVDAQGKRTVTYRWVVVPKRH